MIREHTRELEISKSIAHQRLVKLGYIPHYNVWVPSRLLEKNCLDWYCICNMLLKCNKSLPFLKQLVTGDVYKNIVGKRSWSLYKDPPKQQLREEYPCQKSLYFVFGGIIFYELLPQNQTIILVCTAATWLI